MTLRALCVAGFHAFSRGQILGRAQQASRFSHSSNQGQEAWMIFQAPKIFQCLRQVLALQPEERAAKDLALARPPDRDGARPTEVREHEMDPWRPRCM